MFQHRPHYIPRNRRSNLSKYKYSGQDHSIISRYLLTPYWNRLVTYFPLTIAPNLITLSGLLFVLVNFASLLIYEPDLACSRKPSHSSSSQRRSWSSLFSQSDIGILDKVKSSLGLSGPEARCPSGWLYFSFALGLWIYQSLDAIDGKQARRTGTSGPLGELFDHGCDALNTTLGCILASASLNLGQSWWTVASQVAALANFYLTTWEEYHTGTLYLSSFSGPVEGILLVIGVFLVTSVYGPAFWDQGILSFLGLNKISLVKHLNIKDLPLNQCSLMFAIISLSLNTVGSYMNVTKARRAQSSSNLKTLIGLLPFVLQSAVNLVWLHSQPSLLTRHLILFMIFHGLSFAYLVGLLIVSHILKAPELFPYWNVLLLWSVFGLVDSYLNQISFGYFKHPVFQKSEAGVVGFMVISVGLAAVVYGYFVTDVILDVCDYCDINCLTIKNKSRGGQTLREALFQGKNMKNDQQLNQEKSSTNRKRA